MTREMCYRCFWPRSLCWCGSIRPMMSATRFELLMHPKEFKRVKSGTGRLTHLCLENSEIRVGVCFEADAAVQAIIRDPREYPVLLFPARGAHDAAPCDLSPATLGGRRLVVFVLDATWPIARKMLRLNPSLQALPRLAIAPSAPSRYVIKRQPHGMCLSTLEAVHEVLVSLERADLDRYPMPDQLLGLFTRMQDHQLRYARGPDGPGLRRAAQPSAGKAER